jgi:hypothetical protein
MECQELEPNCGEQVLINVLVYAFCWSFGGAIQVRQTFLEFLFVRSCITNLLIQVCRTFLELLFVRSVLCVILNTQIQVHQTFLELLFVQSCVSNFCFEHISILCFEHIYQTTSLRLRTKNLRKLFFKHFFLICS